MLLLTCGREWNMVDLRFVATRLGLGIVLDTAYVGSNPTDRTNIKDNYDQTSRQSRQGLGIRSYLGNQRQVLWQDYGLHTGRCKVQYALPQ